MYYISHSIPPPPLHPHTHSHNLATPRYPAPILSPPPIPHNPQPRPTPPHTHTHIPPPPPTHTHTHTHPSQPVKTSGANSRSNQVQPVPSPGSFLCSKRRGAGANGSSLLPCTGVKKELGSALRSLQALWFMDTIFVSLPTTYPPPTHTHTHTNTHIPRHTHIHSQLMCKGPVEAAGCRPGIDPPLGSSSSCSSGCPSCSFPVTS